MKTANGVTDTCYQRLAAIWEWLPWQILLLLFTGLFLLRNFIMPFVGDDYAYAFLWDAEHGGNLMDGIGERTRVTSLSDIFASQWEHYFSWGGRTISMLFLQFFVWQGKIYFNFANTIVYLLLLLMVYWLAVGKITSPARHKGCFLWVLLGIQFGVLDYPTTMLWLTGACVYLWTGFWECVFLLPYALAYWKQGVWQKSSRLQVLLMAVAGLCGGWSEEGGSIAVFSLLAMFLWAGRKQGRLRPWMLSGAAFFLLGFVLLMFCPGSLMREQFMLEYQSEYVLPVEKLWTAEMFVHHFTESFLPIVLWESFLFLPILLYFKQLRRWDGNARYILMFTTAGFLVLCAMMFAPEFGLWTGFHSTVFFTIASAAAAKEIAPCVRAACRRGGWRRAALAGVLLCFCYGTVTMAEAVYVEASLRRQIDDRMALIKSRPEDALLVVPALHVPEGWWQIAGPRTLTKFHLFYGFDLESKPSDNRSLMFARYYGLRAICIDEETDWKQVGK